MRKALKTFKVYFGYVFRKKLVYGLFLVVTLSAAITSSVIPYFLKLFVDSLQVGNFDDLFRLLLLLTLVRVLSTILHTLQFYIGDKSIFNIVTSARMEIFRHVQNLDFAFHTQKSTGYLISAFKRGDGAIWNIYHSLHIRFLGVLISFTVMFYFFRQINSLISLVVGISFMVSLLVTFFLARINIKARQIHNADDDEVSGVIVDNMVNFETVKLFANENLEMKRLGEKQDQWLKSGWKFVNTFRFIDGGIGLIINVSIFVVILISINLARTQSIDVGNFVLIMGFLATFYPQLFELVWGFRDIGKNYADVERYFGLLDYKVKVKDPIHPTQLENIKGEIEFKNVSFRYAGGKYKAVKNIDLTIRQGQSVAFVGRSGSGKTTLTKLLMRFYDVNDGEILIDAINVNRFTKSYLRSLMGVVPQEPVLFNNTIAYNIGYGKENATQKEIVAAARLANLHNFIETLKEKYDTNVGERGIKLSGGQKQRLAIARMILSNPDIVIFDEATSQLDSENEKLISEAFWKSVKNKTTIIIAHRLSTAMRADKIIVMEDGRIVETGSHKELLATDSLYKYFWKLQTNVD